MHENPAIRSVLAGRRAPMLALLEELVVENSFTENTAGGERVGKILSRELASIAGMSVHVEPSEHYAPHLVATSAAAASSPEGCVALVGHLDTVFPPDTFVGFRHDGDVIRGPGVLDMKGGLVVVIEALRALAELGALSQLRVRVAIVADEEVGSPEGRPFVQRECRGASAALVFEAGRKEDKVITARKGTGMARVTVAGRAAHAGNAHPSGANAIWALARFVDRAQSLTDYDRGVTVNVGKIRGGHSKNTVPDFAEALVDFRFIASAEGDSTYAALVDAGRDAVLGVPGTGIEVDGGIARMPLERTEANVALYREYAASARAAGLGDAEAPLIGGGSDASSTATIGIPSIDGLGPRGTGFHTHDEMIESATLLTKTEALVRFLLARAQR